MSLNRECTVFEVITNVSHGIEAKYRQMALRSVLLHKLALLYVVLGYVILIWTPWSTKTDGINLVTQTFTKTIQNYSGILVMVKSKMGDFLKLWWPVQSIIE